MSNQGFSLRKLLLNERERDAALVDVPALMEGYLCLFDPLDGSSNIDVNGSVGTMRTT